MVDDDGSEMIEFQEFLSIIKGGSNGAVSYLYFISYVYAIRKTHLRMMELELSINSLKILRVVQCKLMALIIFLSVYSYLLRDEGRFYRQCNPMTKKQRRKAKKFLEITKSN